MSIFNREEKPSLSIEESIKIFKELTIPMVKNGDIEGVNNIYRTAFSQVTKGLKRNSLEHMQAAQLFRQALRDVLNSPERDRKHYFGTFRDNWWRK